MVSILNKIIEMEDYAKNYNIPIMQKESIEYIKSMIDAFNLCDILEIGTAIGYSTINFASVNEKIKITSIERDESRFKEAVKNVSDVEYNDRINLILKDALEVQLTNTYDLIIIDAAKGQNINFFNKFKNNLKDKGIIIVDNLKFHGLVGINTRIESKNLRQLVGKIEKSIEFLKEQSEFIVEFSDLGDGLAICKKK